ncbi:MAG TPA: CvpA family protein [Planctomycetota bacterium]|nr:CvpA family protein [Planctomycetota bacterium]
MTVSGPAALDPSLVIDAAALVSLALFLVWGGMHGALRQALGLGVVLLAFVAASAFASVLESSVAKVADLPPDARGAVAWLVVWALAVVVGGVALHGMRHVLEPGLVARPASRILGALIGLTKGILVLGVFLYAVLGTFLESPTAPPVEALRTSRTAATLVDLERRARAVLRLPASVGERVALANATVTGRGRTP